MKRLTVILPLLVLGGMTTAFAANDRIAFADLGGIQNFRPDGDQGIYIEGRNRQWYHASFLNPCHGLKFNERVGFVLEPTGDVDRFSSILVDGDQCYFKSFDRVDEPKDRVDGLK